MNRRQELEQAIHALEAQRPTLGNTAVNAATAGIRAQLAALAGPAQEQRKLVTILFADLVGFTALSERLDPEDAHQLMNDYFAAVTPPIGHYNGVIEKYIGDAIMAVFGLPEASEYDPEQAIRAALAMQAALTTFNERLVDSDIQLGMRIGVNTGPVLVSDDDLGQKVRIFGDAVNVASRLETAAPAGGVLIAHDTYRHVRGVFDVQGLSPIQVKGKSAPLSVYLVQRAKPRAFRLTRRGVEGIETRMIGRDAELQTVQEAYTTARDQHRTTVITIVGEAGLGKSRLLHEFEKWVELRPEQIRYFKGRATPQTQAVPHHLLRDCLARRFQIRDNEPHPVAHAKFQAGLARFLPGESEQSVDVLGVWLGYNFCRHDDLPIAGPDQLKQRASRHLASYFRAIGAQQPAILFLEDIHWADGASLTAIADLIRAVPDIPLLIVALSRPGLGRHESLWAALMPQQTITLQPLTEAHTRCLARDVLRLVDPLPPLLPMLISERAEGNPFYVEELIKMLIDQSVIQTSETRWQVNADTLLELDVPPTLTGVLQARMDRLDPPVRQTLQKAAVIGRTFWDKALLALDASSASALATLVEREFIIPQQETTLEDTVEYLFKHAILRDVVYETVLKRERRRYHAQVAQWLMATAQANDRGSEYAGLIGDHFFRSGSLAFAAGWYARAGQHAMDSYNNQEAANYLSLALAHFPPGDDRATIAALSARERLFDRLGQREAQRADLEAMSSLTTSMTISERANLHLRWANLAIFTGQYDQVPSHSQMAIELAEGAANWHLMAIGYRQWGLSLYQQGKNQEASVMLTRGLDLALKAEDDEELASGSSGLGLIAYSTGDYQAAADYFQRSLTLSQASGAIHRVWRSLNNLGAVAFIQGDYPAAQGYYTQTQAVAAELEDPLGEATMLNNLAEVAQIQGDLGQARQMLHQAQTICRRINDPTTEAACRCNQGLVELADGAYAAAEIYFNQAFDIFQELDQGHFLAEVQAYLAYVKFLRGERSAAADYALPVVNQLDSLTAADQPLRAAHALWQTWVGLNRPIEARQTLTWAGTTMERYLQENENPTQRATYLQQPDHAALWAAWQMVSVPRNAG